MLQKRKWPDMLAAWFAHSPVGNYLVPTLTPFLSGHTNLKLWETTGIDAVTYVYNHCYTMMSTLRLSIRMLTQEHIIACTVCASFTYLSTLPQSCLFAKHGGMS